MRHRILSISILLLLLAALLPGGWDGVLAAASSCVHDDNGAQSSPAMTEDHDCCPAALEQSAEHCEAASPRSSTHDAMEMDEAEMPPVIAGRQPQQKVVARFALNGGAEDCLHCVRRSGLPPNFILTRAPKSERRDADNLAPPAPESIARPVIHFAPLLSARQHAPPEPPARRHLLLGVFVV